MKNFIYLLGFIGMLTSCSTAQNTTELDQKLDSKKGREIVLEQVTDDSRCPEGVQCIWAGEVTITVAVYDNRKLVEQSQLTLNPHNQKEIIDWFVKRLPKSKKSLQSVTVAPYPKDGTPPTKEPYRIVLGY